ncbi:hypothetical protein QYF36_021839 [Acer negundo]|nr:hypothetical protein QYF36_021839 [Acer negundo]
MEFMENKEVGVQNRTIQKVSRDQMEGMTIDKEIVEGGVVNKEMDDSPSFGRHGKKRGFVAKKHGMIAAEKKKCDESNIILSWNMEEATKIIETDDASGYDFNDKEMEHRGDNGCVPQVGRRYRAELQWFLLLFAGYIS